MTNSTKRGATSGFLTPEVFMSITAVKPTYNRKTKTYDVHVVKDASPLMAQEGYFVYDDAVRVLPLVESGRLVDHWNEGKRAAVVAHLKGVI